MQMVMEFFLFHLYYNFSTHDISKEDSLESFVN